MTKHKHEKQNMVWQVLIVIIIVIGIVSFNDMNSRTELLTIEIKALEAKVPRALNGEVIEVDESRLNELQSEYETLKGAMQGYFTGISPVIQDIISLSEKLNEFLVARRKPDRNAMRAAYDSLELEVAKYESDITELKNIVSSNNAVYVKENIDVTSSIDVLENSGNKHREIVDQIRDIFYDR